MRLGLTHELMTLYKGYVVHVHLGFHICFTCHLSNYVVFRYQCFFLCGQLESWNILIAFSRGAWLPQKSHPASPPAPEIAGLNSPPLLRDNGGLVLHNSFYSIIKPLVLIRVSCNSQIGSIEVLIEGRLSTTTPSIESISSFQVLCSISKATYQILSTRYSVMKFPSSALSANQVMA